MMDIIDVILFDEILVIITLSLIIISSIDYGIRNFVTLNPYTTTFQPFIKYNAINNTICKCINMCNIFCF